MERAVWIILNSNFSLTLDSEIKDEKVVDKKFSPGNDLWTSELPKLGFTMILFQTLFHYSANLVPIKCSLMQKLVKNQNM